TRPARRTACWRPLADRRAENRAPASQQLDLRLPKAQAPPSRPDEAPTRVRYAWPTIVPQRPYRSLHTSLRHPGSSQRCSSTPLRQFVQCGERLVRQEEGGGDHVLSKMCQRRCAWNEKNVWRTAKQRPRFSLRELVLASKQPR